MYLLDVIMALTVKFAGSGVQNCSVPVQLSLQVCQGFCSVPFTCSPHCPSARLETASFAAPLTCRGRGRGRLTMLRIPELRQRSYCRAHRLKREDVLSGQQMSPQISLHHLTFTHNILAWGSPTSATHKPRKSRMHIGLGA